MRKEFGFHGLGGIENFEDFFCRVTQQLGHVNFVDCIRRNVPIDIHKLPDKNKMREQPKNKLSF
jgi:hypothetical protein